MANFRYVHVGDNVTCLLTENGQFVGAVKCSREPSEPWAFAVDPNGVIVIEARGELADIDSLYTKCERVLEESFAAKNLEE
jgi:hypothetical protein